MGGTKQQFESSQQYYKVSQELELVNFVLDFPNPDNSMLFDRNILHKNLLSKITQRLNNLGIKNKHLWAEKGGGGLQTLWDVFKALWENRDLVGFFVSFFGSLQTTWQLVVTSLVEDLKPTIGVHFFIEADTDVEKIEKDQLQFMFSRKLANLLTVAANIKLFLEKEFEGFTAEISLAGKINSRNISIDFILPNQIKSLKEINSLLRITKDLKIKTNRFSSYKQLHFGVIERKDSKIISNTEVWDAKNAGTYYLIFSTNIFSDYF